MLQKLTILGKVSFDKYCIFMLVFVIENCEYTSHTTNNMGTLAKLQVIIIKNLFLNSNNLEETTISFDYFSLQCFIISYECNMTVDKITILPNTVHTKYLLKSLAYDVLNQS